MRGIEGGRVLVDKPIQANLDKSSRRSELWHNEIKATWCILIIRGACGAHDASLSTAEDFTGRFTMR